MLRTNCLLAVILVANVLHLCATAGGTPVAKPAISLEDYLLRTGKRLNCHFTIEAFWKDSWANERRERVLFFLFPNPIRETPDTVDALASALEKGLPDVKVVRNLKHPNVIHLVDQALIGREDYVMDKKVDLEFSGPLSRLSVELNRQYLRVGPPSVSFIEPGSFDDSVTDVSFRASGETVRDILTNRVPLKGYSPIVWRAITYDRNGAPATSIQYYGAYSGRPVFYFGYLIEMGRKLGCYFTVERADHVIRHPGRGPSFWRSAYYLEGDTRITSVDALVEKLRREMKGMRIVRNRTRSNAFHLIDEELLKLDQYPSERKVDLQFAGEIRHLPYSLQEAVPGIGPVDWGGGPGHPPNGSPEALRDVTTRVNVTAKGEKVRSILTDCVPLKGYCPVLWLAQTHIDGKKHRTYVSYHGPDGKVSGQRVDEPGQKQRKRLNRRGEAKGESKGGKARVSGTLSPFPSALIGGH